MITINNFAGEGLGPLTCAHLRLTDVTAPDASQHNSMGWFRFSSPAGAHKDRPTVVMAKLYKASLLCCPRSTKVAATALCKGVGCLQKHLELVAVPCSQLVSCTLTLLD